MRVLAFGRELLRSIGSHAGSWGRFQRKSVNWSSKWKRLGWSWANKAFILLWWQSSYMISHFTTFFSDRKSSPKKLKSRFEIVFILFQEVQKIAPGLTKMPSNQFWSSSSSWFKSHLLHRKDNHDSCVFKTWPLVWSFHAIRLGHHHILTNSQARSSS